MDRLALLISGGRKFTNQDAVDKVLRQYIAHFAPRAVTIIHGKAPGADTCADVFGKARGYDVEDYPAKWDDLNAPGAVVAKTKWGKKYNAKAGHQRNGQMRVRILELSGHVVAFWNGYSPGTKEMIKACKNNLQRPLMVVLYDEKTQQLTEIRYYHHDTPPQIDL